MHFAMNGSLTIFLWTRFNSNVATNQLLCTQIYFKQVAILSSDLLRLICRSLDSLNSFSELPLELLNRTFLPL